MSDKKKNWISEVYPNLEVAKSASGFEWADEWKHKSKPASVWKQCSDGSTTGIPGSIETTEENAYLIAAAPDLLEALEAAMEHIPWTLSASARAAIAKAKGGGK